MIPYEQQLNGDFDWALDEGGKHFEERNYVHRSLRKITRRLEELAIPFVILGDLAMFFHGFRRFTEVIELLVPTDGLLEIRRGLEGCDWVSAAATGNDWRDEEFGVRITFRLAGEYPGDSRPKPLCYPHPAGAGVVIRGIPCLQLATLIELKLVSGASPRRRKDWGDVQELIRVLNLPLDFADQLNPYVQDKFQELWAGVQSARPDSDL